MPSLTDKSFELGYTDPLWGVNIDKKLESGRIYIHDRVIKPSNKTLYKDKFNPKWNLKWFSVLERICKGIILVIGEKYKYWWIKNTNPIGDLTIHWINGHARGKISQWSRKSTYLFYGKFKNKLQFDIILNQTLKWGFLSDWKGIHPSPKGVEIILKIIKQLKPESLIDPFIGSGSYGQACEILKIPWLGYEINELYRDDIKLRMSYINTSKSGVKYWLE